MRSLHGKYLAALLTVLSLLGACTDTKSVPLERRSNTTTSSVPDGWVVEDDPEWLYEIAHPSSWRLGPLLVSHGDIRQWEMLSLGTYELRPGSKKCPHMPANALNDLGPQDAFLSIQEPEYIQGFPPRPSGFTPDFTTRSVNSNELSIFRCVDARQDFHFATITFEDRGRNFVALLALGLSASEATRIDLLTVLGSLQVR